MGEVKRWWYWQWQWHQGLQVAALGRDVDVVDHIRTGVLADTFLLQRVSGFFTPDVKT
jgi:hypothetical protein